MKKLGSSLKRYKKWKYSPKTHFLQTVGFNTEIHLKLSLKESTRDKWNCLLMYNYKYNYNETRWAAKKCPCNSKVNLLKQLSFTFFQSTKKLWLLILSGSILIKISKSRPFCSAPKRSGYSLTVCVKFVCTSKNFW